MNNILQLVIPRKIETFGYFFAGIFLLVLLSVKRILSRLSISPRDSETVADKVSAYVSSFLGRIDSLSGAATFTSVAAMLIAGLFIYVFLMLVAGELSQFKNDMRTLIGFKNDADERRNIILLKHGTKVVMTITFIIFSLVYLLYILPALVTEASLVLDDFNGGNILRTALSMLSNSASLYMVTILLRLSMLRVRIFG